MFKTLFLTPASIKISEEAFLRAPPPPPRCQLVSGAVGGGTVEARRAAVLAGRRPADRLTLPEAVGQLDSRQLVDWHEDSGAVALVGQAQWTTGQRRQTAQHVTSERLALAWIKKTHTQNKTTLLFTTRPLYTRVLHLLVKCNIVRTLLESQSLQNKIGLCSHPPYTCMLLQQDSTFAD